MQCKLNLAVTSLPATSGDPHALPHRGSTVAIFQISNVWEDYLTNLNKCAGGLTLVPLYYDALVSMEKPALIRQLLLPGRTDEEYCVLYGMRRNHFVGDRRI